MEVVGWVAVRGAVAREGVTAGVEMEAVRVVAAMEAEG